MTTSEESAQQWAAAWKRAAKFNHSGWAAYCSAGANQQKALKERAEEWEARHAHCYDELCEAVSRAVAAEKEAVNAKRACVDMEDRILRFEARAEAAEKRAEWYDTQAQRIMLRCSEALTRAESAEALLREARVVLEKVAPHHQGGHSEAGRSIRALLAKLAAREGQE